MTTFGYPFSTCGDCARLTESKNHEIISCQAFPKGIPSDILIGIDKDSNAVTHTVRRKDQNNDLVFVDLDDLSLDEIEKMKKEDKT